MLLTNNLLYLIVLTLVKELCANNRVKRKELDPQTCMDDFDIQRNKIIRTEESREMGAKYLNEMDVGSREECHKLCCDTLTCDVFIYEEKIPGSCYMFHCGPPEDFRCKFTRHSNFTSGLLTISRTLAELEDQARLSKHVQDLTRLRRPRPEPTTTPELITTLIPTPKAIPTTRPFHEARRCSRYQFECHSGDECIAIYNACDGIAQCADGSDEAPELGCPAQGISTTTTPPKVPPPREIMTQQKYTAKVHSEEPAIYAQPVREGMNWPSKSDKATVDESRSRIFTHKDSLLTNLDSAQMQPFMPYVPIQEGQWERRQWPHSMDYEGKMVHNYPAQEWKQQFQIPYQNFEAQPQMPMENPVVQLEPVQNIMPLMPISNRDKMSLVPVLDSGPSRDNMWAVPQTPMQNPVVPRTFTSKTMPETPIMYSNKQGTLRDSPKKGFDLIKTPKKEEQKAEIQTSTTIPPNNIEPDKSSQKVEVVKEKEGIKKELPKEAVVKTIQPKEKVEAKTSLKDEMKSEIYQTIESVDEGFTDKPPGAIFLLILGILMTSIMVTMLFCRIRVMRWRVRSRGGGKAYDADYLVNGMYL